VQNLAVSLRTLAFAGLVGGIATAMPLASAADTTPPAVPAALVAFKVAGDAIPVPLTSKPGDPVAGRAVIEDRKLGNCLSCHNMPFHAADPGNIGPDLAPIAGKLSAGQFRLRVVNMKLIDPTTIMPAYYRVAGLNDVLPAFVGKPILTAQQVEDVVAFLAQPPATGAPR